MCALFRGTLILLCCVCLCHGLVTDLSGPLEKKDVLCNETGSEWQPTLEAFQEAGTLSHLIDLYRRRPTGERFDRALGRKFGDNYFQCGLSKDQCNAGDSCFDFLQSNVSAWVYQVANAAQNFDNLLNNIYTGINVAQTDATELTPNLVDQVFHWKNPSWDWEQIVSWIGFALSIMISFGAAGVGAAVEASAVAPLVVGAFSSTGVVAGSITPQIVAQIGLPPGMSRNVGIDQLNAMFYAASQGARTSLEKYADKTFAGNADHKGNTIVDILGQGGYTTQQNIPSQSQIESFYLAFLVAKSINAWWQQQQVYVISTTAKPDEISFGYPQDTAWTSKNSGRTYIPYFFDGSAPQEPPGLSSFDGNFYGIHAKQIAESAGRAWEVAPFNYTSALAAERIQASFASNGALRPFQDGAGWEGVFNLGVCDIQDHKEWVVPYGTKVLPCCCGPNCNETRQFVRSVNLENSYSWLHTCLQQLKDTDVNPSSIDYGIDPGTRLHWWWNDLGYAKQAAFIVCCVFLAFFFFVSLIACCAQSACLFLFAIILAMVCAAWVAYLYLKPDGIS